MAINKILIVDDVSSQIEAFKSAMPSTSAHVITASSGKKAVELAKSEKPDIIFLDIIMDDMDGYGACRQLVSDEETKDIPIVFVSTKDQRADQMWAEKQGGRALLGKPVTTEQIQEQLDRFG